MASVVGQVKPVGHSKKLNILCRSHDSGRMRSSHDNVHTEHFSGSQLLVRPKARSSLRVSAFRELDCPS